MNIHKAPNTTDQIVLLVISGGITLAILPFAVLQIMQQDWGMAIMNSFIVATTTALFVYVLITKRSKLARMGISILMLCAMLCAIYFKGPDNVLWVYPGVTTTFFLLSPMFAAVFTLIFLILAIAIIWADASVLFLLTFSISAATTLLFSFAFSIRMRTQTKFMEGLATTDSLTGVGNRRKLEEKLMEVVNRLKRKPNNICSLIIFDIDFFKLINDRYGHGVGDKILQKFSILMMEKIRKVDSFYRLGGEEFVLVLEDTHATGAKKLAEKLALEVEYNQWDVPQLRITTSIGIAQYINNETSYDWLHRADEALYFAKSNGRNMCVVSQQNEMVNKRPNPPEA